MTSSVPSSPPKKRPLALLVLAGVLVCGLALQVIKIRNLQAGEIAAGGRAGALTQQLPAQLAGWVVRDEPLGANEFMQSTVERTLNYDDYVYRIYRRGTVELNVYVAYWSAGRMPTHKVASHTPDRCWTENGWTCLEMGFNEELPGAGQRLPVTQRRRFKAPNGSIHHVAYWHLVGKELYDYGSRFNVTPHPLKWWRDTLHYAVLGSQDQYFIRISSDQPLARVMEEPGVSAIVEALVGLGLSRETIVVPSS